MVVGGAHVFPGFLTPVLTQIFFPKQPTTFLTCFLRGKRRKYAEEKVRFNWGSNSQPPGHESDFESMMGSRESAGNQHCLRFQQCFYPFRTNTVEKTMINYSKN